MTLEPTTAPDRARPGLALLVMASGLAGLATGMALVSRWPSEPPPGADSPSWRWSWYAWPCSSRGPHRPGLPPNC